LGCLKISSISIFYKGITNISNLDPYVSYSLSSLAEIFGYSLCFLNDKFGRKRMLIIFLTTSSLVCLVVALIPVNASSTAWLVLLFASLGKACASAAFNSCYVYSSYFFPTRIQNTMVLLVCSMGRLGSVVSPQINLLGQVVWSQLPYFIFSGGSFIGNIFIFLLPHPESIGH
jgi:MFS family permease